MHYFPSYEKSDISIPLSILPSQCDLLIVGGGFAGCSAALEASHLGLKVCLIEKEDIGSGQSGQCGGQFIPGFEVDTSTMIKKHGQQQAHFFHQLSKRGLDDLLHLFPNEFQSGGMILSLEKEHSDYLKEEKLALNHLGIEANWVDKNNLNEYIISPIYQGGLLIPSIHHANPLKINLLLARKAFENGVQFHLKTQVLKIKKNSQGFLVNTTLGDIQTKKIFLAGGKSILLFHKYMSPTVFVNTCCLATQELGIELQKSIIPQANCFYDAQEATMDYFRIQDNRLIFGGGDSIAEKKFQGFQYLKKRFTEVFPQLQEVQVTHLWQQGVDVSSARMPVLENHENIWIASGYSGQGAINSFCAGKWAIEDMFNYGSSWKAMQSFSNLRFPSNDFFNELGGKMGAKIFQLFSS